MNVKKRREGKVMVTGSTPVTAQSVCMSITNTFSLSFNNLRTLKNLIRKVDFKYKQ